MKQTSPWWHTAAVYQVYPKSFQDSNEDGIGDLPGLISRLDYLQTLGISAIWLSPVCRSPQVDNGYDISDYRDIDPMFGTLDDMKRLISEAKKRGIGIILDLVLNHTSDQHPWFLNALQGPENPYHDYYIWRDGTEDTPPSDLKAIFGGSAWQYVPELGKYYFHKFAVQQPDLNWKNPNLRREIYDMINWWLDLGVCGFRLDVIDQIAKEVETGVTKNGPMLHPYLQEMCRETWGGRNCITVGETWGATVELAKQYSNPDGSELSMVFQFEHDGLDKQPGCSKWQMRPLNLLELKEVFARWQTGLEGSGWNSLFWNNHDLPRIVSRWGNDGAYRERSAKMLALLLHGMGGTPYIYQGEELGMTNAGFTDISQYRDLESLNYYREQQQAGKPRQEILEALRAKSRDNSRTPMQWDGTTGGGFSAAEPWIAMNPNHTEINAADQLQDPDSVFHFYRRLIELRKQLPVMVYGSFRLLMPEDPEVFAYSRTYRKEHLVVLCNFYGSDRPLQEIEVPETARLLLSNAGVPQMPTSPLAPYEARLYYFAD